METKEDITYEDFFNDMASYSDRVQQKMAIVSQRKGKRKFLDTFVFGRVAWSEALTYVAIVQSGIIFLGLIPAAITTVNETFDVFGIPFHFPVTISSVGAVIFIIFVFIFGLFAHRIGLHKRGQEITQLQSPGFFMFYSMLKKQEKEIKKLKEKLDEKSIHNRN